MTSGERWRAVFRGEKPDRVPTDFWATGEVLEKLKVSLGCETEEEIFRRLSIDRPVAVKPRPKNAHHPDDPEADHWGIRYAKVEYGSGSYEEAVHHPLANAETAADLEDYAWPAPEGFDFSDVEEQISKAGDRPVRAGYYEPFLRYCALRGMEKSYEDLVERPALAEYLLERLFDIEFEVNRRLFSLGKGKIDITYVAEDLGGQQNLLISPAMYRRFLKPHQRKMIALAHSFGIKAFYHSDGAIRPLIPDLIEIGIDILNPLQWRCKGMALEGLARDFGASLIFHGGVDNQKTLPFGTPEEVRREVRDNLAVFKKCRYILAPCHNIQPVTPVENIVALYEAALEFGSTP